MSDEKVHAVMGIKPETDKEKLLTGCVLMFKGAINRFLLEKGICVPDSEDMEDNVKRLVKTFNDQITLAQQANQRLVEMLEGALSFGQHHFTCHMIKTRDNAATCSCGLYNLRAAFTAEQKGMK